MNYTHRLRYGTYSICIILCCLLSQTAHSQVEWKISSPLPNTTVPGEDVFVSVTLNAGYTFASIYQAQIFLDNVVVKGNLKVMNNELYFMFPAPVAPGAHQIRIESWIPQLKEMKSTQWSFSVGGGNAAGPATNTPVTLKGAIVLDNRSEFLSGSGQGLRQEPNHTRTISIDGAVAFKNAEMPVRIFMTSNNKLAQQTMNFYQVGFKNKWLQAEAGDINPNFDRLVLTGIRVRGVRAILKYGASSLQLCYGQLSQAREGSLETYIPGSGVLPTNLLNDTQYIVPGIYRRTMAAARIETGDSRGNIKIGFTGLKAKDNMGSITYGLAPKENIAGASDLVAHMFRKKIGLQAGIAFSIFTNDISNGPLDKAALDSTYNIKLDFDPKDFRNIITLNASTIPTNLNSPDYLSYYGQLTYSGKYQRLSVEYKKNGALFISLGNPFQRINYEGFFVNERLFLLQRKIIVGLGYQDYSNNLNGALPSKIFTRSYRGNVSVNMNDKWPSLFLSYMNQSRNGESEFAVVPATDDVLTNYMASINFDRSFWNIDHHFFIMVNVNDRKDRARNTGSFSAFTATVGINERFGEKYSFNAEAGKMLISDATKTRISNNNTYSVGFDWEIRPNKYATALSVSNNRTLPTLLSNASDRMSAIAMFRYLFWRGMELQVEGGYQPFRDKTESVNNYNESYIYIRYTSDLGKLFHP